MSASKNTDTKFGSCANFSTFSSDDPAKIGQNRSVSYTIKPRYFYQNF